MKAILLICIALLTQNTTAQPLDQKLTGKIRNTHSTSASQVYFGQFGDIQAAVSLQWLDDLHAVRGAIFPVSPKTGLSIQWQFIGTNHVEGEINIHIYNGKKQVATGTLNKSRKGDYLIWSGRTGADEKIHLTRELQREPAPKIESQYQGKIGTSDIHMTLDWGSDRRVTGSYKNLTSGKTYQLKGDNTFDGFIYLDEFLGDNISARIILQKKHDGKKIIWLGKTFALDGTVRLITIARESKPLTDSAK